MLRCATCCVTVCMYVCATSVIRVYTKTAIAYLCGILPLVQDLLPYHSLVWFFPTQLLDCMGFSIFSRNGLCSLMICWFLLVPAGVPVLVSLLLSSFFPQDEGSVPSWFAGSSWFRLGFRCLSPFFSLLSCLRKGVLFHHDLLVLPGSGWGSGACLPSSLFFGSGACLPSSLFFRSSGKGLCSIMICWFLLVPAGVPVLVSLLLSSLVPVLVSLLLSSFFPQERGSVPSWFAGSSWFRLGFQCLSPFFSLLSCLRKGVLFHHDVLVPLGSGWGSGACLPSSLFFGSGACLPSSLFFLSSGQGFCYIMICWFLLVPAGVPVLVSLLLSFFLPQERGSVPSWFAGSSWFRLGFRCLSPFLSLLSSSGKGFCSIMICWFLLVPAGVPVLVSLLLSSLVPLPFSLLLSSFFPQVRGSVPSWFAVVPVLVSFILSSLVPVLVSFLVSSFFPQERGSVPSWFAGSSWFRLGFLCLSPLFSLLSFRCLSPFLSLLSFLRKGVLFHHDLLVPPGSGWGSGACLLSSLFFFSSGKGFCSFMICWFLLVPAGVPLLVSLLLFSFFPQGVLFHHDFLVPLGSGWGFGACLPSSLFFGSVAFLPSSLFFLSAEKGFCSIMICWFFLLPAGVPVLVSFILSSLVPVLVSFLVSSFFPQDKGSVPSWFAGSSWFRLGFRCLSPFFSLLWFRCLSPFSLLSFLGKGVLFHHGLLVPLGSGWGSGTFLPSSLFFGSAACLPSSLFFLSSGQGFCSIMVPAGVPVLVSLLLSSLFPQERGSVPSWFRPGFRCLSPFFSLLSSLVPVLVSLLLSSFFPQERGSVPSWFAGSGWGSGACLPSSLVFGSDACLPSSLFFLSSGQGFCCSG